MFLKTLYIFSLIISILASEEETDYYENLIYDALAESKTYRFPKDATEYKTNNEIPRAYGKFDYIIVGGGTAGSVIASRLSEVPSLKILLLEAGMHDNNFTDIPAMALATADSEYNWGFNSTIKKTCCLDDGGLCTYPRGKGLGGSSIINYLIYNRGNKVDYDEWEARGSPGWSYNDVLPYFIKSENLNVTGDKYYHGHDGYLNINYMEPFGPKTEMFINGSLELGQTILDYNGRSQFGASRTQLTTENGRRDSAAKAFLKPALNRKNLKILTRAYVTKILISQSKKSAYGVIFAYNNVKYCAGAKREVILSAGSVNSPHLLMLSGVGPKEELKKHNIPLKMSLPVGKTFYDQPAYRNLYFLTSTSNYQPSSKETVEKYLYTGQGPLIRDAVSDGIGFFLTSNFSYSEIEIDFQSNIVPFGGMVNSSLDFLQPYSDPWNQTAFNTSDVVNLLSVFILVVSKAKSVGSITLQSNDPYQYPIIDFPCLEDPLNEDIDTLYEGIQHVLKYFETDTFKQFDARVLIYRPCSHLTLWSKEYWICCLRMSVNSAHNGVASCKMGPNPQSGVVDNKLRVYGIKNLRVADASVIPFNLACDAEAPALMIGERLSEFLLN